MEADTDSIRELELYAENTAELYSQFKSIIANVQRRIQRGTYNPTLAPKLWRYWYDEAARRYKREFGTADWSFPVAVRQACAEAKAIEEYAAILAGEYDAVPA